MGLGRAHLGNVWDGRGRCPVGVCLKWVQAMFTETARLQQARLQDALTFRDGFGVR